MLFSCYFGYCSCTDVGVPRADLAGDRAPVEDAAGVHQPEGAECSRVVGGCTHHPCRLCVPGGGRMARHRFPLAKAGARIHSHHSSPAHSVVVTTTPDDLARGNRRGLPPLTAGPDQPSPADPTELLPMPARPRSTTRACPPSTWPFARLPVAATTRGPVHGGGVPPRPSARPCL